MSVFVFDSSAVLRYLDHEAGAERVKAILRCSANESSAICISALQWGEIAAVLRKRYGAVEQKRNLANLVELQFRVIAVSAERAVRAAAIRVDRKMAFADAFGIELAMDSPEHLLVTSDYDFKKVEDLARIEFLPVK